MQQREKVKKGFDRLSPIYDAAAFTFFGRALWRAQSHFISSLTHAKHALIIGGGTGKILTELLRQKAADRYYYLDLSGQMVKRARQRVEQDFKDKLSSVTFHTGDIHDLPPGISFDLIITPFLLDMIDKKKLLNEMKIMDSRLEKNSTWHFTDFNYPSRKGFTAAVSRPLIGFLYFAFRLFTGVDNRSLPDFHSAFTALGYKVKEEKYFLGGLLVTRIYQPRY